MSSIKTFAIIIALVILAAIGVLLAKNASNNNAEEVVVEVAEENKDNSEAAGIQTQKEVHQPSTEEIASADYIFFYGVTCPYCQEVEDFMDKNGIDKKTNLVRLEIYNSQENKNLMGQKLDQCRDSDIKEKDKGAVPFLYSKDKCIVGSTPIIEYLKEKAGI